MSNTDNDTRFEQTVPPSVSAVTTVSLCGARNKGSRRKHIWF